MFVSLVRLSESMSLVFYLIWVSGGLPLVVMFVVKDIYTEGDRGESIMW